MRTRVLDGDLTPTFQSTGALSFAGGGEGDPPEPRCSAVAAQIAAMMYSVVFCGSVLGAHATETGNCGPRMRLLVPGRNERWTVDWVARHIDEGRRADGFA